MKKSLLAVFSALFLTPLFVAAQDEAAQPVEYRLRGIGTMEVVNQRTVFMLDDKRITPEEFAALDNATLRAISVDDTSSCNDILTEEEIAAGKDRIIAATSKDNPYPGTWILLSENGKPQSCYQKRYNPYGTFSVRYGKESNDGGVRIFDASTQQRGKWSEKDGVITEVCQMGDKGEVAIQSYIFGDDTMVQTFSYPSAPDVQYVQTYVREEALGASIPTVIR